MWARFEPWQLRQLALLAERDLDRAEHALNTLWSSVPGLYEHLTLGAAAAGDLSYEAAATLLGKPEEVVRALAANTIAVQLYRPVHDAKNIARVAEGQLSVWEIVRVYRKLGSVESLVSAFPGVDKSELAAALRYAEENPAEIEALIAEYESVVARRRTEYPFSA